MHSARQIKHDTRHTTHDTRHTTHATCCTSHATCNTPHTTHTHITHNTYNTHNHTQMHERKHIPEFMCVYASVGIYKCLHLFFLINRYFVAPSSLSISPTCARDFCSPACYFRCGGDGQPVGRPSPPPRNSNKIVSTSMSAPCGSNRRGLLSFYQRKNRAASNSLLLENYLSLRVRS